MAERSNVSDPIGGPPPGRVFIFGPFELHDGLLELRKHGATVHLEPKPLFFLLYLIRHRERVVSPHELLRELWPDVRVSQARCAARCTACARRRVVDRDAARPRLSLRGRDRGARAATTARAPLPAAAPEASAFLDREAEMARLREMLGDALAGGRRVTLLHDAPGIGKTRTAMELGREAARQQFEVHVGRTHEGGGAPPFWPWIQILRSLHAARGAAWRQRSSRGSCPSSASAA